MLSLNDIVTRTSPPTPWSEGDNIPWNDPEFSERMLAEHLSQQHDLASRRTEQIDAQVSTILTLLVPPPGCVLDLACGPGLYLNRLAAKGYHGVGIDFSPASIRHARTEASTSDVEFCLDDIRSIDFGSGFDAVLLLYGQLNVFRRSEARSIVNRAFAALRPGGMFIVEPQAYAHIEQSGNTAPSWSSHEHGLFSAQAHVLLTESFWDPDAEAPTERFYVIDAATGDVTRHALSNEAHSDEELDRLLEDAGFEGIQHRPSLVPGETSPALFVVTAIRAG
jgi:SAM-dependent methyltransferase